MWISLPLIFILGALLVLAMRFGRLNPIHAFIAVIFGFLLASTTAAPEVNRILNTVLSVITGNG